MYCINAINVLFYSVSTIFRINCEVFQVRLFVIFVLFMRLKLYTVGDVGQNFATSWNRTTVVLAGLAVHGVWQWM